MVYLYSTKLVIKSKHQPLHQRRNTVDIEQAIHHLQKIIKGETETETLRHLALETMNTRYPKDKCLHILTDGSQIEGYINTGAGIHCELFFCYMPLGQQWTAFDGGIETIPTTLRFHHNKFETAAFFSDPKAAVLSETST